MSKVKGYIYYILCGEMLKIGYSKDINRRMKTFKTGNPNELKLLLYHEGTTDTEWFLHKRFEQYRKQGTEWFEFSNKIRQYIDFTVLELEARGIKCR